MTVPTPAPRPAALATLAALVALAACALPTTLAAQPAKPRRVDAGAAVTADASIRFSGAVASLRVVGWDRDSIAVAGTLPAGARLDGFFGPTKAPARGAKMYVELPGGAAGGALELRVPARARLWVKLGVADVAVSGVTGTLDVNVVGGSIAVTGSPRELRAEAMDGTVTVDGAPAWLRVKTATGDVLLRGGEGTAEDVGVATVSGAVRVPGGRYERVRLESVTGPVSFGAQLARGAALDVETHSGDVTLALRGASAEVDVVTITGTVTNRLTAARPVAGRDGRGQELGFTLGDGAARVVVRSFKGAVRVLPDAAVAPTAKPPR